MMVSSIFGKPDHTHLECQLITFLVHLLSLSLSCVCIHLFFTPMSILPPLLHPYTTLVANMHLLSPPLLPHNLPFACSTFHSIPFHGLHLHFIIQPTFKIFISCCQYVQIQKKIKIGASNPKKHCTSSKISTLGVLYLLDTAGNGLYFLTCE